MNVGIDVIEIKRFREKPLNKENASFYHSIFTKSELLYCTKYSDPYPHIAGIFSKRIRTEMSYPTYQNDRNRN